MVNAWTFGASVTRLPLSSTLQRTPDRLRKCFNSIESCHFSLANWRDTFYDIPGASASNTASAPPKSICILPFPYHDCLLQGETKQLRLFEDKYIQLFHEAINDHCGVVAMGLLAQAGIIQTVCLCEIEDYNTKLQKEFGIFCTIRVVSRANLLAISQQEPFWKGTCLEVIDRIPPNLDLPNLLADDIETAIFAITSMEYQLQAADKNILTHDSNKLVCFPNWESIPF
jgi:hypothetical protein